MPKRNYINATVEFHDCQTRTEMIFKVGEVDLDDDMHVFAYLKSEDEIEALMQNGHPEFKVIAYWEGKNPNETPFEFDGDGFDDFIQGKGYDPAIS